MTMTKSSVKKMPKTQQSKCIKIHKIYKFHNSTRMSIHLYLGCIFSIKNNKIILIKNFYIYIIGVKIGITTQQGTVSETARRSESEEWGFRSGVTNLYIYSLYIYILQKYVFTLTFSIHVCVKKAKFYWSWLIYKRNKSVKHPRGWILMLSTVFQSTKQTV